MDTSCIDLSLYNTIHVKTSLYKDILVQGHPCTNRSFENTSAFLYRFVLVQGRASLTKSFVQAHLYTDIGVSAHGQPPSSRDYFTRNCLKTDLSWHEIWPRTRGIWLWTIVLGRPIVIVLSCWLVPANVCKVRVCGLAARNATK